jgi:hypothetical protein
MKKGRETSSHSEQYREFRCVAFVNFHFMMRPIPRYTQSWYHGLCVFRLFLRRVVALVLYSGLPVALHMAQ